MHQHKKNKHRQGSTLADKSAHFKEHQRFSRRSFLRNLGIAGGVSMVMGNLPLTAFASSPFHLALSNGESDRVLVLIRMKGGNDGLNMIVPKFDYDFYANLRPTIRIPENKLIDLQNDLAMPDSMTALRNLWDDGKMKVLSNVGYPDPSLSHFRSTDIWGSASDADVVDTSGWLGRYLSGIYSDYLTNPPERPPAIQIGGVGSILFTGTDNTSYAVNVSNPEELFDIAKNGRAYDVVNLPECQYGEQLGYLRAVANSTYIYAEIIKESYDASSNSVSYGNGSLKQQLALVARLIKGGLGTKMYMVNIDGFDTHADQNQAHPRLIQELSEAIDLFYKDLAGGGRAKDVLSMTYSEFGRRVQQNASGGTDHGTAAPVLLFGEGLNGSGVVGANPSLRNLDADDNMIFSTDFRELYATILEDWLCVDTATVDTTIGKTFDRLPLGIECQSTPVFNAPSIQLTHQARYSQDGFIHVFFSLPETMKIDLQIFNILGQPVTTLFKGQLPAGDHSFPFATKGYIPSGHYVYRLEANGQVFSSAISVSSSR